VRYGYSNGGYNSPSESRNSPAGGFQDNYAETLHTKYGQSTSLSSSELFGNETPYKNRTTTRGYQDTTILDTVYGGWNKVSTYAHQVDLNGLKETITENGQKGWAMAIDYFNMAKNYLGDSNYSNLESKSTNLSYSGSSGYNQNKPYPVSGGNNYFDDSRRANPPNGNGRNGQRGRGRGPSHRGGRGGSGPQSQSQKQTCEEWDNWDKELGVENSSTATNDEPAQKQDPESDAWNDYHNWDVDLHTEQTSQVFVTPDEDIWDFNGSEKQKINKLLDDTDKPKPISTAADGWDSNW
jgi:hypothetical protein